MTSEVVKCSVCMIICFSKFSTAKYLRKCLLCEYQSERFTIEVNTYIINYLHDGGVPVPPPCEKYDRTLKQNTVLKITHFWSLDVKYQIFLAFQFHS